MQKSKLLRHIKDRDERFEREQKAWQQKKEEKLKELVADFKYEKDKWEKYKK